MTGTLPPYDVGLGDAPNGIKGVPLYKSTDLKNWIFVDCINGGPGLVLDRLAFGEPYGAKTVTGLDRVLGNGSTWGSSTISSENLVENHRPVRALNVWVYASVAGTYTLPDQVDIRLENGFRVWAPVQWGRFRF